jgi:hypothetical protein
MFYTSTLCKELGVGLVAVVAAWELLRRPLQPQRLVQRWLFLAAVAAPYFLLRMYLSREEGQPLLSLTSSTLETSGLMRRAENPFAFLTGTTRVLSLNFLQVKYAQLLVFPKNLCAEYSYNCIPAVESVGDPRMVAVAVLDVIIVACVVHVLRRPSSGASMSLLVLAITFLPASNIFFRIGGCGGVDGIGGGSSHVSEGMSFAICVVSDVRLACDAVVCTGTLVAERILYLPSVGFCLVVGRGMMGLHRRLPTVVCLVRDGWHVDPASNRAPVARTCYARQRFTPLAPIVSISSVLTTSMLHRRCWVL